jgi:hypothetical protein
MPKTGVVVQGIWLCRLRPWWAASPVSVFSRMLFFRSHDQGPTVDNIATAVFFLRRLQCLELFGQHIPMIGHTERQFKLNCPRSSASQQCRKDAIWVREGSR